MERIARRICRGRCKKNARSTARAAKALPMARTNAPLREAVGQRNRTQVLAFAQHPRRFRLSKCIMEYPQPILRRVVRKSGDFEGAEAVGSPAPRRLAAAP